MNLVFLLPKCAIDEELKAEVADLGPYIKYNSRNLFEGRRVRIFDIIAPKFPLAVSPYSAARMSAFNMGLYSSEIDFPVA